MAYSRRKYPGIWWNMQILLLGVLLVGVGCNLRRTVPDGEFLLFKNKVTVHGKAEGAGDLNNQVLHRPNKRIVFGVLPFYLWLHKKGTNFRNPAKNESVKWRRKLREDIGEPPVILDTSLAQISADNLRKYLFNLGYFENDVRFDWKGKRKKARVIYHVYPEKRYFSGDVVLDCADSILYQLLKPQIKIKEAFVDSWKPIVFDQMDQERTRLSKYLRNLGYFTFTRDNVSFELDTHRNTGSTDVVIHITPMADGSPHRPRIIRNVHFQFITGSVYESTSLGDTLRDSTGNYSFLLEGYPLRTSVLTKSCLLKPGSLYRQDNHERTYGSLIETDLFRLVEISFSPPVPGNEADSMDMLVVCRTATRQAYSIEPQGIYSPQGSSGTNVNASNVSSYGLAGNLSFTNRNVLKNGEKFNVNLLGSIEAIINSDQDVRSVLYGFQAGGNANLLLPRPVLIDRVLPSAWDFKVNTILNLAYQYESNPNFIRKTLPASITYQMSRKNLNWYYTPLEVSFNRNRLAPGFRSRLGSVDSLLVARIFTDHLLTAARFGFVYNNRKSQGGNWWFLRANLLETSGNLHRLVRRAIDRTGDRDTAYNFLGVNYFQYLRSEIDLRYNIDFDENNKAVFRTSAGLGIPFGNTTVLPFDKRFFAGGSNSLRAWRPRRIGPGTFSDSAGRLLFDRSGELLVLLNAEYRFQVLKRFLEGALFLDAGNIWNLSHRGQLLPGVLRKGNLLPEMAVNTGVGFRFDFQFFLIRFDWGIPLRDPSEPAANRWVIQRAADPGFIKNHTALTLGIGYPF
jgi:hypothetical protein